MDGWIRFFEVLVILSHTISGDCSNGDKNGMRVVRFKINRRILTIYICVYMWASSRYPFLFYFSALGRFTEK